MRIAHVGIVLVGALCIHGCKAPMPAGEAAAVSDAVANKDAPETVLARVGGTTITEAMLEEKINTMPPQLAGRFRAAAGKKNLLRSMVDLEVLYLEAQRQGLDKDKETIDRLEDYRKKLAADKLREQFLTTVKVDEADVRAEYEKGQERYTTPKRVRVSQIVFIWDKNAPPKDIAAVEKEAGGILERAKKGDDFALLAKQYSLDQASAKKGGDIGYVNRRALPPEAYDAAMALAKEGDVSGLIKSGEELRILKVTEIVPEKKKPFEEVKPWLERTVQNRKQRELWMKYTDELRKREGVVINEDKIVGGAEGDEPREEEAPRMPMINRPPLLQQGTPMQ